MITLRFISCLVFSAFTGYEIAYFAMVQPTMNELKKATSALNAMRQSREFWYDQAHMWKDPCIENIIKERLKSK